jgi:hypothetical protein
MRSCKATGCGNRFEGKGFVVWCSPECGSIIARQRLDKKKAQAAKEDRKTIRARKETIKTRAEWMKEAQREFNAYIRARDQAAGYGCISCGRHHQGQYHAGHYLSVGARPDLRFSESNCHLQCAPCNTYLSGNLVLYRLALLDRIGEAKVAMLEGPSESRHYDISDLKAIKEKYKKMVRELKKNSA